MDPVKLITSIGMIGFGLYLIRIGTLMLVDKKYRKYAVDRWLNPKTRTPADEKAEERHIQVFRAPFSIFVGCMFIYLAIFLLLGR